MLYARWNSHCVSARVRQASHEARSPSHLDQDVELAAGAVGPVQRLPAAQRQRPPHVRQPANEQCSFADLQVNFVRSSQLFFPDVSLLNLLPQLCGFPEDTQSSFRQQH